MRNCYNTKATIPPFECIQMYSCTEFEQYNINKFDVQWKLDQIKLLKVLK